MEEFQQLLQDNGVELTDDEMELLVDEIIQDAGDEDLGELSEDELVSISGGVDFWQKTRRVLKLIIKTSGPFLGPTSRRPKKYW